MVFFIEDIKTYFAIDKEDKALRVEKLIELLDTPLATYIDEDIATLITDEYAQVHSNFIDDIIDNHLDTIENTLEDVLNSLEGSNDYIEYLVYNKPNEPTDEYYELIDTSVDINEITIE
ncbi:MAG: hypothetical protein RRZ84_02690 [Romboutsia sp.]